MRILKLLLLLCCAVPMSGTSGYATMRQERHTVSQRVALSSSASGALLVSIELGYNPTPFRTSILFEKDAYMICAPLDVSECRKAEEELMKLIQFLSESEGGDRDRSKDRIKLTGFTCSLGDSEANRRLGLRRAETVRQFLVEHGISEDRISVATAGEDKPIVPNDTEKNRKLNRRVDLETIPI